MNECSVLIYFCEAIASGVFSFAVIFTVMEIILHIRKKIAFSGVEELRLLHILMGSALILALLSVICFFIMWNI